MAFPSELLLSASAGAIYSATYWVEILAVQLASCLEPILVFWGCFGFFKRKRTVRGKCEVNV